MVVRVNFGFMAEWYTKKLGIVWDEATANDPIARAKRSLELKRRIRDLFPYINFEPIEPNLDAGAPLWSTGANPECLFYGAKFRWDSNINAYWTGDHPWEHIKTIEDIENIPIPHFEEHPIALSWIEQHKILKRAYPKTSWFHGPSSYVLIGYKLMGQKFWRILLQPSLAKALMEKDARLEISLLEFLADEFSAKVGESIGFSDCIATALSPRMHQEYGVKFYKKLLEHFNTKTCSIHCCGYRCDQLIEGYSQIPNMTSLQLGPGTNVKLLREHFPEANLSVYIGADQMSTYAPNEIRKLVRKMVNEAEGDKFIVDMSVMDSNVRPENIKAAYDVLKDAPTTIGIQGY